jgi:predicted transcriptional regulator
LSGSESSYRDRIYIVKDLIMKLVEHTELNQTTLLNFCGLNLKKHKPILDELESNGFVRKLELPYGKRTTIVYKPTPKGLEFCTNILEPYEKVFPRRKAKTSNYQGMKQHEDVQKKDITEESQENIAEVIAPELKEKKWM